MNEKHTPIPDPCPGYAMIVGGAHPYVSNIFIPSIGNPNAKEDALSHATEKFHSVERVVVVRRSDWNRLLKFAKGKAK